ncbi:MAG: amidohydrolase family protein [Gemmatimonadales bacterium]
MRSPIPGTFGLALFVLAAGPARAAAQGSHAFVDVNVVPMDMERVLEHHTVLVTEGKIVQLGPAAEIAVPQSVTQIDGRGKYLMPGLAEMHGHLPAEAGEFRDNVLFLYVANGVTTVRGMQGAIGQLAARDEIKRLELLGPRLYVSSPAMSGNRVTSAGDAAGLVREYHAEGYDHVKVHEGLSRWVYMSIARTAREVGIDFAGHITDQLDAFEAMAAGQASIDHMDNMLETIDGDESRFPDLVKAVVEHGTGVVPTEVLWETAFLAPPPSAQLLAERTEVRYMPPEWRERWTRSIDSRRANMSEADFEEGRAVIVKRRRLLEALYDGGALVLLGTDSPQIFSVPGFSIHREMQVMVEAGLTPYEVLVTGTRNIARYFATSETEGTIAVGKRADLILVEGNPLGNIANVARRAGVMVNGRWIGEGEIRERLAEIARAYAN